MKKKRPSKELLKALERLASQPRICLGCQDRWHRERFRRADKIYCSSRCFKRIWRQGVEAAPFMKIREEAEYNERAFEDELATYQKQLRTGKAAVRAVACPDEPKIGRYWERLKAGRGGA